MTVLAAVPLPGRVTPWDADGGATDSATRVLERREEDKRALAISKATPVRLDFPDAQYVAAEMPERPTQGAIASSLEELIGEDVEVYGPAGIGNTDHAFVRDALLRVRPDATLYADLPYALRLERASWELPSDLRGGRRLSVDVRSTKSFSP